jgi:hypothetical protein
MFFTLSESKDTSSNKFFKMKRGLLRTVFIDLGTAKRVTI